MSKLKTNKSAKKRFKIGKTNLFRRRNKQNHFNARATGDETREKRGYIPLAKPDLKNIKRILPYA